VADARARTAARASIAGGMLAGVVRAVAGVGRARIAVFRTAGAVRLLRVGGAGSRRAGAALGEGALVDGGAAGNARRLERIGGAGGTRPGARLGDVADVRRRAAGRAGVAGGMLAGVVRAVAGVGRARIAVVRTGRAAGCFCVRRAGRGGTGAALGGGALVDGSAAGDARCFERVGRARGARARAGLGDVAEAGGGAAGRAGVAGRMLARIARAVAGVVGARVAVVGARRAVRLLRVGGTGSGRAGAVFGEVALVRGGPTDRARRDEGVRGACGGRARARLGDVAEAGGGAAGRAGVAGRMLARIAGAVAGVVGARVAVVGARRAVRLLRVGGTGSGRAGAVFGEVALVRGGSTHRARRDEGVRGACGGRARARLGDVAEAGGGAAGRAGVAGRMLARIARAVADVVGARVAVVGA